MEEIKENIEKILVLNDAGIHMAETPEELDEVRESSLNDLLKLVNDVVTSFSEHKSGN